MTAKAALNASIARQKLKIQQVRWCQTIVTNLEINLVDWADNPEKPVSDEVQGVGERIWQVRVGQCVAACLEERLERLERVGDGCVVSDEIAPA